MAFTFQPKSEDQLNAQRFLPDGIYPYEVRNAQEKVSAAGNPMIEMEVLVFLPDGRSKTFRDWLTASMEFKLFHFCSYTGLGPKYQQGSFDSSDCIGRQGFCKIGLKKDKNGNEIKDYVRDGGAGMKKPDAPSRPKPTDDQLANVSKKPDLDEPPF
jgi:hypothetical protein